MRTVLLLLTALWALTAVPAESAPPQGKQLTSQDVLKWINSYRAKPDPTRLSEAVRAMSALGLFRDLDQAGIYIGFMAGVIGDNKAIADTLVGKMFPIPPEDQVAVIRAIAYSGLPDWKDLLGRFIERMPARTVLIQRHLAGKLPDLKGLPLDQSPAALDTLWGFYFATGRFPTIDRIIGALAWSKDANNVERLTLGLMAKWTLANNAQLDKELLDHLKAQLNAQPKEVAKDLREIIEAAETFE